MATNEPLMGELRNGAHTGFDVEIARYIAASLGYEGDQRLRFVSISTEDRIPTRLKDRIRTIENLRDPKYKICTSGSSTTEAELEKHQIKALVVKDVGDCVEGIRAGRYDAVSSDEAILAGFLATFPTEFEIVDMPFGTSELLGIGVPIGDPALRDLVAFFLQKSYQQGRDGQTSPWLTAYGRTLGPWLRAEKRQPQPLDVPKLVDFDDKAPRR